MLCFSHQFQVVDAVVGRVLVDMVNDLGSSQPSPEARSAVVLSGYASPLYDQTLTGWDRHTMAAGTGQSGEWGNRTEVLWSNRPLGPPTLDGFDDLDGAAS